MDSRTPRRDQAALQILPQVLRKLPRRGVPAIDVLLQRLEADRLQVDRDLAVEPPIELRILL
jgi:hypothetical protein